MKANERQRIILGIGCILIVFSFVFAFNGILAQAAASKSPIRAVYFGSNRSMLADQKVAERKANQISELIAKTEINAVVMDAKDDSGFHVLEESYGARFAALAARFKAQNGYLICRIVVFKDTRFPRTNPAGAIKRISGSLWADRRGNRWYDPADPEILAHTLRISRRAVELGCDELNYDYIRFPSPIDGSLHDAAYPFRSNKNMRKTLERFFAELRNFSNREYPSIPISADIFGYVFLVGSVPEVGQHLESIAQYFDIISPMAYPSHYQCGNFGVRDPNTAPRKVYAGTIRAGTKYLEDRGMATRVRPWLQAFSISNISGCGGKVIYGRENFREQIRALHDLGIQEWMAWNAGAEYPQELFD